MSEGRGELRRRLSPWGRESEAIAKGLRGVCLLPAGLPDYRISFPNLEAVPPLPPSSSAAIDFDRPTGPPRWDVHGRPQMLSFSF